ncbi:MAG: hypothetical protein ACK4S4_06185 [Pyrinomonadaceae bacterium]
MSVHPDLAKLAGEWTGRSRLYLPPNPFFESRSDLVVTLRSGGQCLDIGYDWSHEGERHEGVYLLMCDRANRAERLVSLQL